MMLYRYEFEDGEGIIRGIDRLSDIKDDLDDYCVDLISDFEKYLPCPNFDIYIDIQCKSIKTKSYFTEHGNEKFKHNIDLILQLAKDKGMEIRSICISDSILDINDLVYKDMFQVIYKIY